MEKFVVHGGRKLNGEVTLSGSKNAVLPIMAASLMAQGTTVLHSVPDLADVDTLGAVLCELGLSVSRLNETANAAGHSSSLELKLIDETSFQAPYDLVRRMRASICVLGPLLARRGRASVSLPGGCNLGHRPIELHLKGLRALGADIQIQHGYVYAHATQLQGAHIFLGGPFGSTVTGTCNIMSAATLAKGTTILESAACEPEVVDLGNYLNAMGAKIKGLGTPHITVEGVDQLHGTEYHVIPDRIEAATLLIAAAIAGDQVILKQVPTEYLTAVLETLREIGVSIELEKSFPDHSSACRTESVFHDIRIQSGSRLTATDIIALPYPGFPTDAQAQFTALLSLCEGISIVTDKVFPDRFMHISELARLGAQVRREGNHAIISGVRQFSGASVMASDLRASAALVLAGLAAEGTTSIRRIYHLDRGYDHLDEKLRALGASIERIPDTADDSQSTPFLRGPSWSRQKAKRTFPLPERSS